jgi:hypothetical protein
VTMNRAVLPPGKELEEWVPWEFLPSDQPPLGISFTDNRGRRWRRLPKGELIEATKGRRRSRKDYMNAWIAGELDCLDY